MRLNYPKPFCAPTCPAQGTKPLRWHKSCFRCPYRKVKQKCGNYKNYCYDILTGHLEPIDCYIFSLYVRYDLTIIFYSNNRKHLRYVKDIIINTLLSYTEVHRHYLQNNHFLKLYVQFLEELCK